jgi:hypothetical protein
MGLTDVKFSDPGMAAFPRTLVTQQKLVEDHLARADAVCYCLCNIMHSVANIPGRPLRLDPPFVRQHVLKELDMLRPGAIVVFVCDHVGDDEVAAARARVTLKRRRADVDPYTEEECERMLADNAYVLRTQSLDPQRVMATPSIKKAMYGILTDELVRAGPSLSHRLVVGRPFPNEDYPPDSDLRWWTFTRPDEYAATGEPAAKRRAPDAAAAAATEPLVDLAEVPGRARIEPLLGFGAGVAGTSFEGEIQGPQVMSWLIRGGALPPRPLLHMHINDSDLGLLVGPMLVRRHPEARVWWRQRTNVLLRPGTAEPITGPQAKKLGIKNKCGHGAYMVDINAMTQQWGAPLATSAMLLGVGRSDYIDPTTCAIKPVWNRGMRLLTTDNARVPSFVQPVPGPEPGTTYFRVDPSAWRRLVEDEARATITAADPRAALDNLLIRVVCTLAHYAGHKHALDAPPCDLTLGQLRRVPEGRCCLLDAMGRWVDPA